MGSDVIGDIKAEPDSTDVAREVDVAGLGDSEGVEQPVHTEEGSTEAVLLDHLPQPAGEAAYPALPDGSGVVGGDPVELVGDELQALCQGVWAEVTLAVKLPDGLEDRRTERRVTLGVGRERRGEVLADGVGVLRAEREPARVGV
jgi:hypothetical protein